MCWDCKSWWRLGQIIFTEPSCIVCGMRGKRLERFRYSIKYIFNIRWLENTTTKFSSFLLLHAKTQENIPSKSWGIEFSELRRKSYESLVSCNPTNKSISVFIFFSSSSSPFVAKKKCEYVHQQVSSSPKLNHQGNARDFGERKSDYVFGFVILWKHNGSTGLSSSSCSSIPSRLLLSTTDSPNS